MPFDFDTEFCHLTGHKPFAWQKRLFHECLGSGVIPLSIDVPTGLGKTSVMVIWYMALKQEIRLPRRLVYVVDRRAVVDHATTVAEQLKDNAGDSALRISTLRGGYADNREWLENPSTPAIIVGTVDMIGSRMLFSGYGVSRKMRPFQAGLLGVDTLVMIDESHLVPPFAHLLRAIECNEYRSPKAQLDRDLVPRFAVVPLSATQRDASAPGGPPATRPRFRLEESDWTSDERAQQRLRSVKRLRLENLFGKKADERLAEEAWELAKKSGKYFRVVVFCDRREKHGDGPSAQGVEKALAELAGKKKRLGSDELYDVELLVGARRGLERDLVSKRLACLGFIGDKRPCTKRTFLIATAAGEVGVDVDADHMVSDLVAWERMVQRLGRVNRRGEGEAEVVVFWSEPPVVKDPEAPTEAEQRAQRASAVKAILEETRDDLSPLALRRLVDDPALQEKIEAATTPEPLRPALTRAVVEAWSMTSLETHTGRPQVGPWLRGWVEEEPQTTLIWRRHLPLQLDANGYAVPPNRAAITGFLEAAAPHETEKLEAESWRVAEFLKKRAENLLGLQGATQDADSGPEDDRDAPSADMTGTETALESAPRIFRRHDVVAIALSPDGTYHKSYKLAELKDLAKDSAPLASKLLVLDGRFGGLEKGLLNADAKNGDMETADAMEAWSKSVKFRVRRCVDEREAGDAGWRFETAFVSRRDGEGTACEWLVVEHFRGDAQSEDSRSISRPQRLVEHQEQVREAMARIARNVGISGDAAKALEIAAGLHDEGKRAPRWQRAFNASRSGLPGPLAKTRGPIDRGTLGKYRHEFGSLPSVEQDPAFRNLPEEWRDLALHLVAAHHGHARPVIETRGCDDAPESLLRERALAVALRFARQQKRWGPWGLAWWEALLRAADQQASRANDDQSPASPTKEER